MQADPRYHEHRATWGLSLVVIAGLLVRCALVLPLLDSARTPDDPDNYLPLARSLAGGQGFSQNGRPTAYRPPLYPIVLAPIVHVFGGTKRVGLGVALLHVALGAATIVMTYVTAKRWGMSLERALVAAAIVAFDPVLIAQARSVMTETLAAFLTAATLAALTSPGLRGAAAGGFLFGLAALCRPSAWPAVLLTAGAAFARAPGGRRDRATSAGVLLASAVACVSPWAVRNAAVFGEPVFTTTHGGYTLALANNPVYYEEVLDGPPGAVWSGDRQWLWWDSVNRAGRGLPEPEADRRLRDEAVRFVASRPVDFLRAGLARVGRLWGVAPAAGVYSSPLRAACAAWTIPVWVALGLGLSRRETWKWPRAAAGAWLVGLTLVHTLYWTDMRMRAAVVPAVALVAASAGLPGRPGGGK